MLRLRSFKLRLMDRHVRIVPETDASGCPFAGPGVDLRGASADRAFEAAAPLLAALLAAEPGVILRSVAIDLAKPRLLATLEATAPEADGRPRVVRIDEGALLDRILESAEALTPYLQEAAAAALAARSTTGTHLT